MSHAGPQGGGGIAGVAVAGLADVFGGQRELHHEKTCVRC